MYQVVSVLFLAMSALKQQIPRYRLIRSRVYKDNDAQLPCNAATITSVVRKDVGPPPSSLITPTREIEIEMTVETGVLLE
jgi:hypothetical protein